MTDFDYGLAKAAIRITSDRSERVWLWFWPQMTAIRDRMIAAAKQDMWEARRESREHVFCGERRGKQCDLRIDQLRTWKGLVRVQFGLPETAAAVLAWASESGIVLVDDRRGPDQKFCPPGQQRGRIPSRVGNRPLTAATPVRIR